METSDNSEGLPLQSDVLSTASVSGKNQNGSVSLNVNYSSSPSKSRKLYESVQSVNPLAEGFIHAGDVEDAFRVSYVDFQQDFMEELKELFFNKFSIELSQMKADIASIKQHQARHLVSSDVIQLLKSENMALKAEVESLRRGIELKTKLEPVPFLPSLDAQVSNNTNFEAKRELFPSASHLSTGASKKECISEALLNTINKESENLSTPVHQKWVDIVESSVGSPFTQGWAIAAASLPVKKSFSPKKKESLSLVISGDIPNGSSSRIKEVLINRFNSQICPAVRGFERDLRIDDLTHVLLEKNSIIARFSSTEAKNVVLDNRKLLSAVCSESDPSTSENPKSQWKMFVSPFLDNQDLKNQNIVLRAFKSLQIKNNPSLSFKVYLNFFKERPGERPRQRATLSLFACST